MVRAAALMVVMQIFVKDPHLAKLMYGLSKVESSDNIDNFKPNIQKESTSCAWDCVVVCR
jgi:hypothetical protein